MSNDQSLFEIVNPQDEEDVVELFDENGKSVKFNIIANLELDEQEYAILSNVDDEEEVLIFKVKQENHEFVFESIEDEAELDAVIEAYNELLDEMGEEDETEE